MLPVLRTNPSLVPFAAPINRMDTFFDQFFGDGFGPAARSWGVPVAMWEDEDRIYVEAELPGVAEADVDVTVHNGMLFIRGERKAAEGRSYLYNGRSYGRFERVITLPEAVTTDDVQAGLTDGVLHIALPKSPEAKPRKIALRTS